MRFIDASCAIGYRTVNYEIVNHERFYVQERVKQARDGRELIEELDFCGIDQAVISHNAMIDVDPGYGNKLAAAEAAGSGDRLLPSWAIAPPVTEPEYAPSVLFPAMQAAGVKLLRAYPARNRYMLGRVAMDPLLGEISSLRIPLYLSPSEGWEPIYQVLQEYPDLTVILTNYGLWSHARLTFPLLRAYPNFYIETGDMQTAGEIREICRLFGPERLLFGSGFPSNAIGGPLAALRGSGISEEAMSAIASGNLLRLLGEVVL
jgi:predicted TIM-barrel fold metal-dependent hydrolase